MKTLSRTISASWPPVVVYLVLAVGILLGGHVLPSPQFDQDLFHYQVVRQFEHDWPALDLTDYNSATAPGYQIVMAGASKIVGTDLYTLRLVSLLFGIAFLVSVAGWCATVTSVRAASFLTMPLAVSIYVLGSGLHIHTDNFTWCLVVLALGPVIFRPLSIESLLTASVFNVLAVASRQVFIWAIGPVIFAGILASPLVRLLPEFMGRSDEPGSRSWKLLFGSLAAAIPPIVMLGVLFAMWGGLVPPRFREYHASAYSWYAGGYALAAIALYLPFFMLIIPDPIAIFNRVRIWIVVFAIIGGILALLGPTDINIDGGRLGGPVWGLVGRGPFIGDRSLVLVALAACGAAGLTMFVAAAVASGRGGPAFIILCIWAATTSTQLLNSKMYARYYDTPSLIVLAFLGALILLDREDSETRAAIGPALLSIVFVFLIAANMLF